MAKHSLPRDAVLRRDAEGNLWLLPGLVSGWTYKTFPIESEAALLAGYNVRLGEWDQDQYSEYCPVICQTLEANAGPNPLSDGYSQGGLRDHSAWTDDYQLTTYPDGHMAFVDGVVVNKVSPTEKQMTALDGGLEANSKSIVPVVIDGGVVRRLPREDPSSSPFWSGEEGMIIFIMHRTVTGVYLCKEGSHWYWGPREQAEVYSVEMAIKLIKDFPKWEHLIGVDQNDAMIYIDNTAVTVPPPRRRVPSASM